METSKIPAVLKEVWNSLLKEVSAEKLFSEDAGREMALARVMESLRELIRKEETFTLLEIREETPQDVSLNDKENYVIVHPLRLNRRASEKFQLCTSLVILWQGRVEYALLYFPLCSKVYYAESGNSYTTDFSRIRKLNASEKVHTPLKIGFDEPGVSDKGLFEPMGVERIENSSEALFILAAAGEIDGVYHYGSYRRIDILAGKYIAENAGCNFYQLSKQDDGEQTSSGYFSFCNDWRKYSSLLVSGAHRSGSTWFGKMMCIPDEVFYYNEPFNIIPSHEPNLAFPLWYYYLSEETEAAYVDELREIFAGHYPFFRSLRNYRNARKKLQGENRLNLLDALRDLKRSSQSIYRTKNALQSYGNQTGSRMVIKDPIAFFSAPYLYRRFLVHPIILIRHPAAFAGSLKLKNWFHPFDHFLRQPGLMNSTLSRYRGDIERLAAKNDDIIENSVLLWNILYSTVQQYQIHFPQWTYIRHEDISLEPVKIFKKLYDMFELPFDSRVEEVILKHSETKEKGRLVRDSRQNIKAWKERLSPEEINRIREGTESVSRAFYSDDDW